MSDHQHPFRPCLVLPTYNNAGTLREVVDRSLGLGLPTYIVNDGSSDDTAAILAGYSAHPLTQVVTHASNKGKAAAMLSGFAAAASDHCTHAVTIDTDGQLDPEDASRLLAVAGANPTALVLGSRERKIAGCPERSVIGRTLANFLIWVESGVTVTDSQCGLRVYPLGFTQCTPVRSQRFDFETEVITRAGWAGMPVLQVPVTCHYFATRVSHYRLWLDTCRAIALHARLLARRVWPAPHPRWPAAPAPDLDVPPLDAAQVRAAK